MSPSWRSAVARGVALFLLAALFGWWFDAVLPWLLLTGLGLLIWHASLLYRVERWARHGKRHSPPDVRGVWGDLVKTIGGLRHKGRGRNQRVRAALKDLRQASAAMPDGVIVINEQLEILWCNKAAKRLVGLRRKRDLGRRIDKLLRTPELLELLHGDSSEPIQVSSGIDDALVLSVQVIPFADARRMVLIRDVSEASRLERLRRDFVSNVSHELRSPLTVISGYLDNLADDEALEAVWTAPVDEMRRQVQRMNEIANDLLELSRLEFEEPNPAPQDTVDVAAVLASIRREALAAAPGPPDVVLELDSHARLSGAESELLSAFTNLLENAIKYTPADGRVLIRWSADATGGHLAIADTGPGIPAEAIPRLTERFYRVDRARDRKTGGTGLGLAIVKHALQRHDAWLEIESELGRGSTFTCHFPAERLVEPASGRL